MGSELFSGFLGVIIGGLLGYLSQRQTTKALIEASTIEQDKLLARMLEERHMMNTRLGQLVSALEKMAPK